VAYEPAPLDRVPSLATRAAALAGADRRPISIAQLDRLVLRNNPDLVAARAKLGIGAAQVDAAGILPNPQISASYPLYVAGPGGSGGFGLSVAQDLKSLILRPTKHEVAANASAGIDASLLWQEWQTIGKARLLYVQIASGERLAKVIGKSRRLLTERFNLTNASINQGNAGLSTLSPDLVAVGDVQRTESDLARLQLGRRHQLNALLGLSPNVPLPLAARAEIPRLDVALVRTDTLSLADRRPDLVALQYGYRSQDAKLRQAVLSQFPNVAVGVLGGRDTSAIYSLGPQTTLELPLFDRNETNIVIERATRDALGQEFKARLTSATGEIEALLSEQALLRRQLAALETRLGQARAIAGKTEAAYRQGSFDERAYVDIEVALLGQEQEEVGLQQALLEGQVALATLTGAGMPQIHIEPERPPADPLGLIEAVSK
jgi:outer membrane protein TolC